MRFFVHELLNVESHVVYDLFEIHRTMRMCLLSNIWSTKGYKKSENILNINVYTDELAQQRLYIYFGRRIIES